MPPIYVDKITDCLFIHNLVKAMSNQNVSSIHKKITVNRFTVIFSMFYMFFTIGQRNNMTEVKAAFLESLHKVPVVLE